MARKKDAPVASTNGSTPSSTEATNGEVTANGTSGTQNGDASSSSDQTYSAHVSGSGAEDENGGCNGYAYVNGYTNGYSYGGGYHMDQSGAVPNGSAYYVNGGSYELYDPYAAMAAAAGYAFPYVGAPPPHPPPPHTIPSLQAIDWYASRPPGSTGDVQWCHLVASPGYSETRRKRYSTDSQNCSPLSSESTGPPGSPQEEAVSSSGGDPCHAHQPIPQYHHAHVFQGPHPHAAAYVYPGYLFGPAVYSVNGVPLAATPIHPLHGLSQSIHVHPSAAVAAPGPLSGHQGGVPPPAAPGSDGGSQRRRKKKRRRKRKRGLTDDASEETSSEVGEEEGGGAAGSGTCGACSGEGGNGRGEEFEEDEEEEDEESGPVVVVRLGNVVPLVMSQPQQMASTTSQPYVQADGPGGGEGRVDLGGREGEASSTDCSELSGNPESSSSTSGGEETTIGGEIDGRRTDTVLARDEDHAAARQQRDESDTRFSDLQKGVLTRDAEVSAQEDLAEDRARAHSEDKFVSTDAETREVWTQSPPEVGVQVGENEPVTPPPSPTSIQTNVPEVISLNQEESPKYHFDDNNKNECSKEETPVVQETSEVQKSEVHSNPKDKPQEVTKHGKRRNGRGKNNRPAVPVIESIESPVEEVQPSVAMVLNPEEVVVQEAEMPQPVIMAAKEPVEGPVEESTSVIANRTPVQEDIVLPNVAPATAEAVPEVSREPTTEEPKSLRETDDKAQDLEIVQKSPESVQSPFEAVKNLEPVQKNPEQVQIIPEPVQMTPEPVQVTPEPVKKIEKPLKEIQESVQAIPLVLSKTEPISERLSAEPEVPSEPEIKEKPVPPATLPLDSFTFKPEPYKYPTYKPYKKDKLEQPSLVEEFLKRETISEPNGRVEEEATEENKPVKSSSPTRHLEDMPRRKARLKEPPEREKPPAEPIRTPVDEVENDDVVEKDVEVKTVFAEQDQEFISLATGAPDNKHQGGTDEKHPPTVAPVQNLSEEDSSKEETLTEVVSKWLEENSDALPESRDEIKVGEMKTEVAAEEAGGENLTGSKNGVRNPFPAPSNRSLEVEMKNVCLCESECVCTVNACVNAFSRDGPEKRVAKLKFGGEDEAKTNEEKKRGGRTEEGKEEKGEDNIVEDRSRKGSAGGDDYDDQGSCEWEPMTVEPPKKGFPDLESWKRLRGSLGGSTEALKSLGSYRGTDDEDEDESRKTRQKMCDPTASVAKYYCLGAREHKSPSPEQQKAPNKQIIKPVPAPTDSGVQTDEEGDVESGDSIAMAEEAKEDSLGQRKSRGHKPVGLGRTAAFVVRQIGTTESAKGPFPCGICCIIQ